MRTKLLTHPRDLARRIWPTASDEALARLDEICDQHHFSILRGDLILLEAGWYVTHTALLNLAQRHHCAGILVNTLDQFCNGEKRTWVFEATVYKSKSCRGFSGMGDACPANVSQHLWGAELRIAETRAVNRALRKAYGIGLSSVEELGSSSPTPPSNGSAKRVPARFGTNLEVIAPVPLRDQLRQIIRQHKLDPVLTKSYALEHLQLKSLRDATREQVRELVEHLQKRLFEDRDVLLQDIAKLSTAEPGKEVA
jgi:hypothetical protein